MGYKARLLTIDDLLENLGYNKFVISCGALVVTNDVPSWVYNSKYSYRLLRPMTDDNTYQYYVASSGRVESSFAYNNYYVLRPVVTIQKSMLES